MTAAVDKTVIEIKATDMEEEDIEKLKETIMSGLQQFKQEKQLAHFIKYEFDKISTFGWNCVVGRNFGSHVVHQSKCYCFLQFKDLNILLWKS